MTTPTPETLAAAREAAKQIVAKAKADCAAKVDITMPKAQQEEYAVGFMSDLIASALTQHARKLAGQMVRETGIERGAQLLLNEMVRLGMGTTSDYALPGHYDTLVAALARLRELTEGKG